MFGILFWFHWEVDCPKFVGLTLLVSEIDFGGSPLKVVLFLGILLGKHTAYVEKLVGMFIVFSSILFLVKYEMKVLE